MNINIFQIPERIILALVYLLLGATCVRGEPQANGIDGQQMKLLDEDILKLYKEEDLSNGTKASHDLIRVTYFEFNKSPVMISVKPSGVMANWEVSCKAKIQEGGASRIKSKAFQLAVGQAKLLSKLVGLAKPSTLPATYRDDTLDGATWVFEFASESARVMVVRRAPLGVKSLDEMGHENRVNEEFLRTFGIVLWSLANISDEPLGGDQ
jgi:hypothetical protein